MSITFAGQSLLLLDNERRLQEWLNDWIPTADGRMVSEWQQPASCWSGTSVYYTGQPLPSRNFSKPLQPRINRWYCPTGASRWSFGLFLADYSALQNILNAIGSRNSAQTL